MTYPFLEFTYVFGPIIFIPFPHELAAGFKIYINLLPVLSLSKQNFL
jgi:hypothetical protein